MGSRSTRCVPKPRQRSTIASNSLPANGHTHHNQAGPAIHSRLPSTELRIVVSMGGAAVALRSADEPADRRRVAASWRLVRVCCATRRFELRSGDELRRFTFVTVCHQLPLDIPPPKVAREGRRREQARWPPMAWPLLAPRSLVRLELGPWRSPNALPSRSWRLLAQLSRSDGRSHRLHW